MFAGARAAVWTETEAGVHAGASGKAFTETGIMTGADRAEAGPERRSEDAEPAGSREQQGLQARGSSQREPPALSSVSSFPAGTVAPILEKPLGLLSKAALTRSFSSSLSKTSAPTTKAPPLRASSTPPPSPGNNRETQTAAASNVSAVSVGGNSSASNSSSHWGKKSGCPASSPQLVASRSPPAHHVIIVASAHVSTRGWRLKTSHQLTDLLSNVCHSSRNLLYLAVWPLACNLSNVDFTKVLQCPLLCRGDGAQPASVGPPYCPGVAAVHGRGLRRHASRQHYQPLLYTSVEHHAPRATEGCFKEHEHSVNHRWISDVERHLDVKVIPHRHAIWINPCFSHH